MKLNLSMAKKLKVRRTYTIDPEILKKFESYCTKKGYKYSRIIEKLMLAISK